MISRSDGRNFHLLLADRPLPYPVELGPDPTQMVSVCFWYAYGEEQAETKSVVVLFECRADRKENLYRQIEFVADVLADELLRRGELATFCNLQGDSVLELSH